MTLAERLYAYARLIRLNKPIGALLLLWPTLWGLWFAAGGLPPLLILGIFILGVFLMRSAGCAINDYADRDFDAHVERTQDRPLASGLISPAEALAVAAVLSIAAFILILPLNGLVLALSLPALLLAASYPFTKRFLAIPQAYLGMAFGFGIPMAYAAVQGEVPAQAWMLMLANVFWSIAYDTEYAMVDRADDLRIGIKTSAITFGRYDLFAIALCYAATLGMLGWIGAHNHRGLMFQLGLGIAAFIAGYHLYLIRGRERKGCFEAFLHNNWLGASVFVGLALDYALE
ncbi:MAG TPA: 4-hydroxybenzoate octaprenyltransferase [Thiobacillaceae bacterium]|nr:4-hydroxybenzoate octaprenyltransferase [Thiobacillaceae bacterium]